MKKIVFILFFLPMITFGAEVSGWIPYWKASEGVKDARNNLDSFTEINPFTITVKNDGSLKDLGNLKKSTWTKLFGEARKNNIDIIPTVMWSNTNYIKSVLMNSQSRKYHIDEIVKFVNKGKYDGIDIDYEGKKADTREYFSAFIIELKKGLGDKQLACTIESRTDDAERRADDLSVIGDVCDQVRIMTYDQQRYDAKLNDKKSGQPYIPVADVDWVSKVVKYSKKYIPKEKIMLGVATYGREWEVTVKPNSFNSYASLWTVTHDYSNDFANELNIEPIRNSAGELSFSYFDEKSPYGDMLKKYKVPSGTLPANMAAAQALAYANKTKQTAFFNIVWWSDAEAINQKMKLADELGLRGISIFKIDGTEDENLWDKISPSTNLSIR
jgi:spore germination protein YaaH